VPTGSEGLTYSLFLFMSLVVLFIGKNAFFNGRLFQISIHFLYYNSFDAVYQAIKEVLRRYASMGV
jgi:hypothetical protein